MVLRHRLRARMGHIQVQQTTTMVRHRVTMVPPTIEGMADGVTQIKVRREEMAGIKLAS